MLGYPGMGKRTIGARLAAMLDGVLVDNQLINRPLIELFRWDGVEFLPPEIWDRVIPIREAVLGVIEDLAPSSNSYVFTNVLEEGHAGAKEYDQIRSVAYRRGSLFLSVMLTCDIEVQVGRIDNPDRVALRKGSDPEGYRGHRLTRTCTSHPGARSSTSTPPRRRPPRTRSGFIKPYGTGVTPPPSNLNHAMTRKSRAPNKGQPCWLSAGCSRPWTGSGRVSCAGTAVGCSRW